MPRAFFLRIALLIACAAVAHGADNVPELVKLFNPDMLGGHTMQSTFTGPATDIARDVNENHWFTNLVFIPFLILPQILLLVTMLKFHDRGGSRKPATFMHHTKLENAWTAIPILTLFIVGVPAYPLLYKLELPQPNPAVVITVRGKQFAWEYEYKREAIGLGADIAGMQEAIVLPIDKVASLSITSNDVNHAWWVPAFGVKKDGINGRFNNVWFTPKRLGYFKGNCAELCGEGHGIMIIGAVVVEQGEYDTWIALQRDRNDTLKVFKTLNADDGSFDENAFTAAAKKYFEKDHGPARTLALRYWLASDFESQSRRAPERGTKDQAKFQAEFARFHDFFDDKDKTVGPPSERQRRLTKANQLIDGALAEIEAVHPVVAAQE